MTEYEKMLAGKLYDAMAEDLPERRAKNKKLIWEFNQTDPFDTEKLKDLLKRILGKTGKEFWIEQPFRCDYGCNIEIGENFYSNYNLIILDVAKVTIGDNVMIAPNVGIYAAGHPIHHSYRQANLEYGSPVTIGSNVWIGGNVVINPGVTIGDYVVIGSGSVVTKDIPDYSLAVGNPCKVLRKITDDDKQYYFKKLKPDD